MAEGTYPITGIVTQGVVPVRPEIDAWYEAQSKEDKIQLSLFVLALERFQKLDYKDKLSYFRIAGIHKEPRVTWDEGVPKKGNGYCVHNNVTFPTWHRVYMILFEQRLYEIMLEIIENDVPSAEKQRWREAASEWRLPYWDFAKLPKTFENPIWPPPPTLPALSLPLLSITDKVNIWVPDGQGLKRRDYYNPLYKFTAPKVMGGLDEPYAISPEPAGDFNYPWDKCMATTKYGIDKYTPDEKVQDAGQNVGKSNLALNAHPWYKDQNPSLKSLRYEVHRLLSYNFTNWGSFASTKYDKESNATDLLSLEFIHNNIHNWIGGSDYLCNGDERFWGAGHMSSVPVAAFDPIFYVYHNNIDRLTAIWQALNPDNWFDKPRPEDDSPTKHLQPFHKDTANTKYISNDVQSWRRFGYDFDIVKEPGTNDNRSATEIRRLINELYGTTPRDLFTGHIAEENDYVINIIYDRYALNGIPYTIYLFLKYGDVEHCVGSVFTFSTSLDGNVGATADGICSNCQTQKSEGVLSAAQIPLTHILSAYVSRDDNSLGSLNPDEVGQYVKDNLYWRVLGPDNASLNLGRAEWETLEVTFWHGHVTYPEAHDIYDDSKLPSYGNYDEIKLS